MSTPYSSNFDLSIPFSDDSAQINLTANTSQSYIVPGTKSETYSVRFGYNFNNNVFVSKNAAFTMPAADTMSLSGFVELNPGADGTQRYVNGGDTLHFVTPDTSAYVSISLRKLPS